MMRKNQVIRMNSHIIVVSALVFLCLSGCEKENRDQKFLRKQLASTFVISELSKKLYSLEPEKGVKWLVFEGTSAGISGNYYTIQNSFKIYLISNPSLDEITQVRDDLEGMANELSCEFEEVSFDSNFNGRNSVLEFKFIEDGRLTN